MVGSRFRNLGVTVSRRKNSVTAVVAVGIYLLFELGNVAASLGLGVRTAVFGIIIGTLTFGVIARWGIFVGLLTLGVVAGDWTGGAVAGLAGVVTTVVVARLWLFPDPRSVKRWFLMYLSIIPIVTVVHAVSVAALGDVSGLVSFEIAVVPLVVENLPLALVGAPVAWATSRYTTDTVTMTPEPTQRPRRVLAVGILFLWATGGYVGSFLFRAVSQVPPARIGERVHPVAESLLLASGYQGVRVVFLFNLLAMTVLLSLLYSGPVHRLKGRVAERWS